SNPDVDFVGEPELGIRPIYSQSDKSDLHSRDFQKWIRNALDRAREFDDPVPMDILDRFDFVDRTAAFNGIHRPATEFEAKVPASRRLVFDELLRIQLALVLRKKAIERSAKGFTHDIDGPLVHRFHQLLPFTLTDGQRTAIAEIERDLAAP